VSAETFEQRRIRFQRVFNVRDLGGLPVAGGGRTRFGHLYRADGVHRLDGDDLEVARGLGLKTVLDLRTTYEIEQRNRFPVEKLSVDWHHLPLITQVWSMDSLRPEGPATDFLVDRYLEMLDVGRRSIVRALELVADGSPALFHCAAGKDRTGDPRPRRRRQRVDRARLQPVLDRHGAHA
jgi:protein-tyrosine phosphatase